MPDVTITVISPEVVEITAATGPALALANVGTGAQVYKDTVSAVARLRTLLSAVPLIAAFTAGADEINFSLLAQNANLVLAGPTNGAAAVPTFRPLVAADIPDLSGTYVPKGPVVDSGLTMATARLLGRTTGATGAIEEISVGTGLTLSGGQLSGTVGTVTSVDVAVPSQMSSVGGPVTTAGTITLAYVVQNANLIWAGPAAGGPAVPTFRSLVAADIPDISGTYQPLDADLTAIAALASTGIAARTGAGAWALRTITGTTDEVNVTNGDGVAGNPVLSLSALVARLNVGQTWTAAQNFSTGTTTIATADINGGAIDGAAIGAASASTGAFTTLTASGNTTITGALTVASDTDATTILGRARIHSPVTDVAYFAHFDQTSTSSFALAQTSAGQTQINATTGQQILLRIQGVTSATVTNTAVTLASGINLAMSGASTFTSGTGASSIGGTLSVAAATTLSSNVFIPNNSNGLWFNATGTFTDGLYRSGSNLLLRVGSAAVDRVTFSSTAVSLASGVNFGMSGASTATFGTGAFTVNGAASFESTFNVNSGTFQLNAKSFANITGGNTFNIGGISNSGVRNLDFYTNSGADIATLRGGFDQNGLLTLNGAISVAGDGSAVSIYSPSFAMRATGIGAAGSHFYDAGTGGASTAAEFVWRNSNAFNTLMTLSNSALTLASGKNLAMSGASTFTSGTGANTFNGQVTITNGTAAAPAIRLSGEAHGLYRASASELGFAVAGVASIGFNAPDGSTQGGTIRLYSLSAAEPGAITNGVRSDSFNVIGGSTGLAFGGQVRVYGHTHATKASFVEINDGTTTNARFDADSTAGNTRFLIYDVDNGTLERVTVGAADSGGAGFKVLRIPN